MKKRYISDLFPLKQRMFEDNLFNVPFNSDHYLKTIYGDYMRLPQINEFENHFVKIDVE